MKKILSLLTISTLSSTVIPTNFSLMLNTKFNSKPNNLSNTKLTSNPFINTVIDDIKTKIVKIAPNGTIWVGTEKGLYKSNDGINFDKINGFSYEIYDIAFAPNGTVWISASGIYKSTDGTNFTKISGDVNGLKFEITANGIIWLSNTIYNCLWKSTDGVNFTKINITSSSKIYGIKNFAIAPNGTIYVIWQEFNDTLHFCKSTDGTNFTDILGINGTINDINFSNNETVYVASTAGLYKSNDGVNFEKLGVNDSFWNIKIAPNGTVWVGGLTSVYKSTDGTNFFNVSKDGNFVENLKFSFDGTMEWQHFLGLFFGRHLFLIFDRS
ncbi:MAG: hypothetical protein H9Q66_01080 [Spiroplasma ixodetis]|nr:hypothetical protein [Spiroplasma ixodetis]